MKILSQFRKIDAPWVLEVITERFGFLPIDAMTDQSLIYGGAIRDSFAGIALRGDLDIVVSPNHYASMVKTIDSSSRWTRLRWDLLSSAPTPDRHPIPDFDPGKPVRYKSYKPKSSVEVVRTRPQYGEHLPLKEITRFINVQGIELEIIAAKPDVCGDEESVIAVPAKVDIICCGLVMDRSGDIYEVVESAYEDCKNRILRFNKPVIDIVDLPRMEERIKKLEKRGWKSEIKTAGIKKKQAKTKKIAKLAEAKEATKTEKTGWITVEADKRVNVNVSRSVRPDGSIEYEYNFDGEVHEDSVRVGEIDGDSVELFGDAKFGKHIKIGCGYHDKLEECYEAEPESDAPTEEVEHTSPEGSSFVSNEKYYWKFSDGRPPKFEAGPDPAPKAENVSTVDFVEAFEEGVCKAKDSEGKTREAKPLKKYKKASRREE